MQYKIPLILTRQPEGGYTVTSPLLPELITEGDSAEDALNNVRDALAAVIEAYEDLGRSLPQNAQVSDAAGAVWYSFPVEGRNHNRHRWLLNLSLAIAILLQLLPTEADIAWTIARHNSDKTVLILRLLCLKACVLGAIFVPLVIHLAYNNWQLKRTFVSVQGIITLLLVTMGMLVTASHICGVATSVR